LGILDRLLRRDSPATTVVGRVLNVELSAHRVHLAVGSIDALVSWDSEVVPHLGEGDRVLLVRREGVFYLIRRIEGTSPSISLVEV